MDKLRNFFNALDERDRRRSATPPPFCLATVDPAWTSGRPRLTFDGETVMSTKNYPYLSPAVFSAGERVLCARVGHTWVVLGRVG